MMVLARTAQDEFRSGNPSASLGEAASSLVYAWLRRSVTFAGRELLWRVVSMLVRLAKQPGTGTGTGGS